MHVPTEAAAIEVRLSEAGIGVPALLERARIDRTTWMRWKEGHFQPRLSKWMDVTAAAEALLAEQAA